MISLWQHNITLAHEIVNATGETPPEIRLRNAINLVYYGALLTGRTYLREKEGASFTQGGGSHRDIIYVFKNATRVPYYTAKHYEIGRLLEDLKRMREKAVYDDRITDVGRLWHDADELAADTMQLLTELPLWESA